MMVVYSTDGAVSINQQMSASIVHDVAEAFIKDLTRRCPLHAKLRDTFGLHVARTYAIDMSSSRLWHLTFSRRTNPRTLSFRGAVAAICKEHRMQLELFIQPLSLIDVQRADTRTTRPAYLQK